MMKKIFLAIFLPFFLLTFLGCEKEEDQEKPKVILRATVSNGIAPFNVELDASESYARQGHIVSYTFSFGDGSASVVTTSPTISHLYEKPGTYWAKVKVKDSEGESDDDMISIQVINAGEGEISMGEPTFGGTGCSDTTATAVLTPDKKGISVLFDEMVAEAGQGGLEQDRKTCQVAIPVKVPEGMSISVFKIDYRGFVSNPNDGQARLNVEYFFAGIPGPTFTKTFEAGHDGEYLLTNDLAHGASVWSECGAEVILRVNSEISAKTNANHDPVLASLDTMDAVSGITTLFFTKACPITP